MKIELPLEYVDLVNKYQPSSKGGTRSPPVKSKIQLSLYRFLNPSTPSLRKGRDGGDKRGKKEKQAGAELCQAQHSLG